MDLYRAQVACRAAGISPRQLDYWVTSRLLVPQSVYRGPKARRDFFLFSFQQLVHLKVIQALRSTGLPLRKIREALGALHFAGTAEARSWLVSDGNEAYVVTGAGALEQVTGKRKGQLAFAAVALSGAENEVKASLIRMNAAPFDIARYKGKLLAYAMASSAT